MDNTEGRKESDMTERLSLSNAGDAGSIPRETGLILRCAGKAGNPFQTTQGNRPSCLDQEGRRGTDE